MGQWKTERGKGSDEMADILGPALGKISRLPEEPTLLDLADCIEFVTRGMLVVELHPDSPLPLVRTGIHRRFAEILYDPDTFKTIPNRGQVRSRKK